MMYSFTHSTGKVKYSYELRSLSGSECSDFQKTLKSSILIESTIFSNCAAIDARFLIGPLVLTDCLFRSCTPAIYVSVAPFANLTRTNFEECQASCPTMFAVTINSVNLDCVHFNKNVYGSEPTFCAIPILYFGCNMLNSSNNWGTTLSTIRGCGSAWAVELDADGSIQHTQACNNSDSGAVKCASDGNVKYMLNLSRCNFLYNGLGGLQNTSFLDLQKPITFEKCVFVNNIRATISPKTPTALVDCELDFQYVQGAATLNCRSNENIVVFNKVKCPVSPTTYFTFAHLCEKAQMAVVSLWLVLRL